MAVRVPVHFRTRLGCPLDGDSAGLLTMKNSLPRTAISLALSPRASVATSIAATLLAVAVLGGCGDPALEQQAKFDREFNVIAASYADSMGGNIALLSSSPSSESLTALRGLAEQAKGLGGGTTVQREAATQLASSIYRTAGAIELARATRIEADQEVVRALAMEAAGLATELEGIAQASESLDFARARALPEGAREAGSRAMRTEQEAVRSLERPLAQLLTQIETATQRFDQLEGEAAVLLRRSRESSPSAGLTFVEEAAKVQAEGREVRSNLTDKEIEAVALTSGVALAKMRLATAEGMMSAATSALDFVSAFEAEVDGQAAKTKALASELRKTADAMMKSIAEERAGALKSAYEAAAADFANASSNAGSGAPADAVIRAIACDEVRMRMSEVQGIGAQARMVSAVGGSGLNELKSAADAAIATLKEKATATSDLMAPLAEDPTLGSLKQFADAAKKSADELTVDKLLAPPSLPVAAAKSGKANAGSKPAATSGRSMSGDAGAGIQDVEAWVAEFNTLVASSPSKASAKMIEAIDASTAGGKAMRDIGTQMMGALGPVLDAMQAKFGTATLGVGAAGRGLSNMAASSPLEKVSIDDTTATFKSADGEQVVFKKGANGWAVNMGSMFAAQGMSEEQFEQMAPMMGAMMGPIVGMMKKAAADIVAKIESGEISSAEQVTETLEAALAQGAGGMMGGRARRGGGAGGGAGGGDGEEN